MRRRREIWNEENYEEDWSTNNIITTTCRIYGVCLGWPVCPGQESAFDEPEFNNKDFLHHDAFLRRLSNKLDKISILNIL